MKTSICILGFLLPAIAFGQGAKSDPLAHKTPTYEEARKFTNDMDAFISNNALDLGHQQAVTRLNVANSFRLRAESLFGATVYSRKFSSCLKAAMALGNLTIAKNVMVNSVGVPKAHEINSLVRYAASYGDEYRQCRVDSETLVEAQKK